MQYIYNGFAMRAIRLGIVAALGSVAGFILLPVAGIVIANIIADHFIGWTEWMNQMPHLQHTAIIGAIGGSVMAAAWWLEAN